MSNLSTKGNANVMWVNVPQIQSAFNDLVGCLNTLKLSDVLQRLEKFRKNLPLLPNLEFVRNEMSTSTLFTLYLIWILNKFLISVHRLQIGKQIYRNKKRHGVTCSQNIRSFLNFVFVLNRLKESLNIWVTSFFNE